MTALSSPDLESLAVTSGEIAVINLESARLRSWSRFRQDPLRPGVAEYLVEQEQFTAQYVGDLKAFDRLETLTQHLDRIDPDTMRTALIHAQVSSMGHRFAEAKAYLTQSVTRGASTEDVRRITLGIDQACGKNLESVLQARQQLAESGRLEDLVPLGGLLADLRDFEQADAVYRQALRTYQDTSAFAVAWVCFQLGVLWGELAPDPQLDRAAQWYEKALAYLPCYVKARVHLSEIYLDHGCAADAEALLVPSLSSSDPEVHWRLADVMLASGRTAEADVHMHAARVGFEGLLDRHLLAFADHAAEFYAGSGDDPARAFAMAKLNLDNRPTLNAFEQAFETALSAGEAQAALEILTGAQERWGSTSAFEHSSLAAQSSE